MSIFGGIGNFFTGKKANQQQQQNYNQLAAQLRQSEEKAGAALGGGMERARGVMEPYMGAGRRAYDMYADSYGLNGDEARQRAFGTFQSDPFNAHSNQLVANNLQGIMRRYNAGGMANSGMSGLAMARAGLEAQDRRIADWRSGIGGIGQTGVGLAGNMAGMEYGYGRDMSNVGQNFANLQSQAMINNWNAQAANRQAGANNLNAVIGLGGKIAAAAMGMPMGLPTGTPNVGANGANYNPAWPVS